MISLVTQPVKLLGTSLIGLFLVSSCTSDDAPKAETGILFRAQTRTNSSAGDYMRLQPGEGVGVYIVSKNGASGQGLKPLGNMYDNLLLTCEREGILTPKNETNYTPGVSHVDFYAYAPYQVSPVINSDQSLVFSVQSNQSAEGAIRKSDLLWSKLLNVSTTATDTPALTFDHSLSKLAVNIKAGVGVTLKDYSMKVVGLKPTVSMNLSNGTLADASGSVAEIIPMNQPGKSEYEAIVIPQTITNGNSLFSITNNGKTYHYTVKKEAIFAKGTKYTFDITINADDLKVEMTGSIKGWNTGDTVTEDIS